MTANFILRPALLGLLASAPALAQWQLPPLPEPELYGNILINRTSTKNGVLPATFSHWSHRSKYTCRVCHLELEFNMALNSTPITENKNKKGQYCGACHNDKIAFGHNSKHCDKCHNGDIHYGIENAGLLADFPETQFGNRIDWVKAMDTGLIKPTNYLNEHYEAVTFKKNLLLESEWSMTPDAIFPHDVHESWLDCSNCHPEIFNIKKKTTKHFAMSYILDNKFCGVCHGKVAFPIDDCKRCHPKKK